MVNERIIAESQMEPFDLVLRKLDERQGLLASAEKQIAEREDHAHRLYF